jgi:hypothetical protein
MWDLIHTLKPNIRIRIYIYNWREQVILQVENQNAFLADKAKLNLK